MWEIAGEINGIRRGMSMEDFEESLLKICEAHRAQGRALAFAFILFDQRQPHVRRMLQDDAYWESLDRLSGRDLTVFSFNLNVRPPPNEAPVGDNRVYRMIAIRPYSRELPTDKLGEYFSGLTLADLPCVLFFQVDREEVVGSFAVKLNGAGMEATYEDLNDIIFRATAVLERVDDENAMNARELFNLVRGAMDNRTVKGRLSLIYTAASRIATVAGLSNFVKALIQPNA